VWDTEYNPAQHDNPARVNVSRLRKVLAAYGLEVESQPDGYRLIAPADFLFIEPAF
jgi:biotin operon repressor